MSQRATNLAFAPPGKLAEPGVENGVHASELCPHAPPPFAPLPRASRAPRVPRAEEARRRPSGSARKGCACPKGEGRICRFDQGRVRTFFWPMFFC